MFDRDIKNVCLQRTLNIKGPGISRFEVCVDTSSPGNPFRVRYVFRDKKKNFCAGFTLVQQINCCGILVSTETLVISKYRLQGIAQEMMVLKETIAKEFGFSMMMATVNMSGNPEEVHILEKFGYTCVDRFINSRTGNVVGIFTKKLGGQNV